MFTWILPEELASEFHKWYELLAPQYGYKTRPDSATDWENVPQKNKDLMIVTARHVIESLDLCRIAR